MSLRFWVFFCIFFFKFSTEVKITVLANRRPASKYERKLVQKLCFENNCKHLACSVGRVRGWKEPWFPAPGLAAAAGSAPWGPRGAQPCHRQGTLTVVTTSWCSPSLTWCVVSLSRMGRLRSPALLVRKTNVFKHPFREI